MINLFEGKATIASVIIAARKYGFSGFGGACGEAAVAINRVLFDGKGEIVGAFNELFMQKERLIGHVAVEVNGVFWDADGQPKEFDLIESWGMLDFEDSDYAEAAEELGLEWSEEAAEGVDVVTFDSDSEVLGYFNTGALAGMIQALEKAKAELTSQ